MPQNYSNTYIAYNSLQNASKNDYCYSKPIDFASFSKTATT